MIKDKEFLSDNFFVIDSCSNIDNISEKLYGYVFFENKFFINSNKIGKSIPHDAFGSYVNVFKLNNSIYIEQDYFGSYGLYVYKKDNYFAVSNSFLYLARYLQSKREMTFNYKYAQTMLSIPTASVIYSRTLINEIEMLPRNSVINISDGILGIDYYEYKERDIDINTKEAIDLLDEWKHRWNQLLKCIVEDNNMVQFSLSGGKDSRVSLATMVSPNIDFNKININSAIDKLYTHSDDYRIASEIGKIYNFRLNENSDFQRYKVDSKFNLEESFFVKCGFHKEIMVTNNWMKRPLYRVTGSGGDLRKLWEQTPEEFIDYNCKYSDFNSIGVAKSLRELMLESMKCIDSNRGLGQKITANDYFYKEARQRNHNGKANVESFLGNQIILSPLMDPVLYRINQQVGLGNDNDLLYALIYHRYLPELDDIDFDSGRIVDRKTKEIAKQISDNYPYNCKNNDNAVCVIEYDRKTPRQSSDNSSPLDILKDIFYSSEVRDFVKKIVGEEAYIWADSYYKNHDYHNYMAASAIVQMYVVYQLCALSQNMLFTKDLIANKPMYSNNGFLKEIMDYINSIRIDIKVKGNNDSSIIINRSDDKDIFSENPEWFKNNDGIGTVLQSCKGKLSLQIMPTNNGIMSIAIKSPWMKYGDSPIPLKVDLERFTLKNEGKDTICEVHDRTISVDNPCVIEKEVKAGDKIEMCLNWEPYVYDEDEIIDIIKKMYRVGISNYRFWKPIKE